MNNTDKNIIAGLGTTEEMNNIAELSAEKTKKHFKKEERKTGYKAPEYVAPKTVRKDGSSEGEKQVIKITSGKSHVVDFESFIKSKIRETKNNK